MLRILRTENFKLTFLYAIVFSLSVCVLGLFVFFSIRNSVLHQVHTHIEHEVTQLMNDYNDDGLDELHHDIRERIETKHSQRLLYFMQAPDGRVIFDPLESLPPAGWHTMTLPDGRRFLLLAKDLKNGYRFAVGKDIESVIEVQTAVRNAFSLAFVLALLFAAAGGLMMSGRFLARVDHFKRIAESVGERGSLSQRLPLSGSGDDFDQLAVTVNTMLARIEQLMMEMKQVTTNIAHDMRTPLGRIRQTLESLSQKEGLTPSNRQKIEEAMGLLDETLRTFTALMRIAEIESGSRRRGFAAVNLSELLSQLVQEYAPVAEEEQHFFHANLEPGVEIQGDKKLLVQLFVNLIENAIHHTPPNTAIYAGLHTLDQGRLQIIVADNGPGVPEGERQNILKPFYRLDQSRNSPGNGLGMSFVSAIAALHNASISIEDNSPGLRVVLTFSTVPQDYAEQSQGEIPRFLSARKEQPFFDDHPFADHLWEQD